MKGRKRKGKIKRKKVYIVESTTVAQMYFDALPREGPPLSENDLCPESRPWIIGDKPAPSKITKGIFTGQQLSSLWWYA